MAITILPRDYNPWVQALPSFLQNITLQKMSQRFQSKQDEKRKQEREAGMTAIGFTQRSAWVPLPSTTFTSPRDDWRRRAPTQPGRRPGLPRSVDLDRAEPGMGRDCGTGDPTPSGGPDHGLGPCDQRRIVPDLGLGAQPHQTHRQRCELGQVKRKLLQSSPGLRQRSQPSWHYNFDWCRGSDRDLLALSEG